jgi:cyclophilin family peptidyl-prolyl cis-trans isomerase
MSARISSKALFLLCGGLLALNCSRPVAQFSYQGELIAPAKVHFENQSRKAEQFEWSFGDGATSAQAEPSHRYRASGNYTVRLRAIQGNKQRVTEQRLQIKAPERCLVELETDMGVMLIELYDATPQHRDNFAKLAEQGFFDSLLFHRVINGFMIQGGDPDSRGAGPGQPLGMGGPGYTLPAEFVDSLFHIKGALAAARMGDQANPQKRSSGSQFYIVQGRPSTPDMLDRIEAQKGFRYSSDQRAAYLEMGGTPNLDRDYTVFGRVIEGLEVIDKIAAAATDNRDRPREDVRMRISLVK